MIHSEDVYLMDRCPRQQLYSPWNPPKLPIGRVLAEALRAGLGGGTEAAKQKVMELAAEPGLALPGEAVYSSAVHHAHLIETIVHYVLGADKKWEPADPTFIEGIDFQPDSWKVEGNRLRRVILCTRYDDNRRLEESVSWRTVSDICATGMPMLLNFITIGSINRLCYRPSVWTSGYTHRNVKEMRIKLAPDSHGWERGFSKDWMHHYRERTNKSAAEWCRMMQWDKVFDGVVHSSTVEIEPDATTQDQFRHILEAVYEGGRNEMRRSSCYDFQPCQFAGLCHDPSGAKTPDQKNWPHRSRAVL